MKRHQIAIVSIDTIDEPLMAAVVGRWASRAAMQGGVTLLMADRNDAERRMAAIAVERKLPCEVETLSRLPRRCTELVALWDERDIDGAICISGALRTRCPVHLYYAPARAWYTQQKVIGLMVREVIKRKGSAPSSWRERKLLSKPKGGA
jgi:hypothetical protein